MNRPFSPLAGSLSRRRFVQGLAVGGVLATTPASLLARESAQTALGSAPVLSGTDIHLEIGQSLVNFTGVTRMATTINGSIPAPTLRLREGDDVTIRVTNRLSVPTSIHWHGILLPFEMDGVPGISFKGIAPGETFVYRFKLRQSGTYWYHSHSGFQEMTGMYGALIIEPRSGERHEADQDFVVQLSDWTDEDPMHVFSKLKVQGDIFNFNQPTFFDFTRDVSDKGLKAALSKRQMWNQMRMNPTDLADLSTATLTYLMNGTAPAGNWTGVFKKGERLRLRFINAASNSFYDVRIPGLKLTVVQADGQDVEPVSVDEFRFGPGETYDVLVRPDDEAYTIFAQSMDRTGYARGTLATRQGLSAPVPTLDPVEWLTMQDMMGAMNHEGMGHDMPMAGMDRSSMNMDHSNMDHSKMDHSKMDHSMMHGGMAMDHSMHGMQHGSQNPLAKPSTSVNHARTEFGRSTPVSLKHSQRVRIILQNDTMMTHPMHLHGMWSELETDQGELRVRRHTIPVQPAQRISFLTTPHDLGRWAWHCHLLFHMDAGMFREVVVS